MTAPATPHTATTVLNAKPGLAHKLGCAPAWRIYVLPVLAFNTLIALGLTLAGSHTLGLNMLYSQAIGCSISALIGLGVRVLINDWRTQARRLVLIVPVAVLLGTLMGSGLADTLSNQRSLSLWATLPRQFWGTLVLSLVASAVMTYFFVSRAQLAAEREAAKAAQQQAAEARLKLLESQLEPHMLFNTLANLRVLIALDPQQAQAMLDHLIAYLRSTLSASRASEHTVAQEFERLHDYLSLMAVRMGPRLRFSFDLPPNLASCAVPALLLQPLVENAIRHGLEPQVQGGHVQVRAQRLGQHLRLTVVDDGVGPGLHWDALAHLGDGGATHAASLDDSGGFGLQQVRQRLHALYGDQAALEIVAASPTGTRASVQFPLKQWIKSPPPPQP